MKFVSTKKASEMLGIHENTIRRYADEGKIPSIKTEKGHRRYNVSAYVAAQQPLTTTCYCRVSSRKQKDDLQRQIAYMQQLYPHAEIIADIGSGINFKRKGIQTLLERLLAGDKFNLVVAHKDILARFGSELFEFMLAKNGGKLVVLSTDTSDMHTELAHDVLAILHSFSRRLPNLHRYYNKIKKDILSSEQRTESDNQALAGSGEVVLQQDGCIPE